jgi:hypothetical protein
MGSDRRMPVTGKGRMRILHDPSSDPAGDHAWPAGPDHNLTLSRPYPGGQGQSAMTSVDRRDAGDVADIIASVLLLIPTGFRKKVNNAESSADTQTHYPHACLDTTDHLLHRRTFASGFVIA